MGLDICTYIYIYITSFLNKYNDTDTNRGKRRQLYQ